MLTYITQGTSVFSYPLVPTRAIGFFIVPTLLDEAYARKWPGRASQDILFENKRPTPHLCNCTIKKVQKFHNLLLQEIGLKVERVFIYDVRNKVVLERMQAFEIAVYCFDKTKQKTFVRGNYF